MSVLSSDYLAVVGGVIVDFAISGASERTYFGCLVKLNLILFWKDWWVN
jgi:hypothetical protein